MTNDEWIEEEDDDAVVIHDFHKLSDVVLDRQYVDG